MFKSGEVFGKIIKHHPNGMVDIDYLGTIVTLPESENELKESGSDIRPLLAPNGQPSNLPPAQYALVRTPAFKAWFGDWEKLARAPIEDSGIDEVTLARLAKNVSKIVDENGEPMFCWHGTNEEFNEFRDDVGHWHDEGFYGNGFYFTFGNGQYSVSEAAYYGRIVKGYFIQSYTPFDFSILSKYKGKDIRFLGTNSLVFLYNVAKMFPEIANEILLWQNEKRVSISIIPDLIEKYQKQLKLITSTNSDGEKVRNGYLESKTEIVEYDYTSTGGKKGSYERIDFLGECPISYKDAEVEILLIEEAIKRYDGISPDFHPEGYMTRFPQITEAIKRNHDSIMQSRFGDEIVVFKPTQIKLADGTNTTYDGANPDIRLAKGGSTTPLLAPNGKPSNLNEVQYKLVRTPAFKAWFGDWEHSPETASKVVDSNGEPMVAWHGSDNSNITEFHSTKGVDYNFFTTELSEAKRYGAIIKPYFIDARNIFNARNIYYNDVANTINHKTVADRIIKSKDRVELDLIKELMDNPDATNQEILWWWLTENDDNWVMLELPIFQKYIKDNKYDSFVTNESQELNIAVYNPTQIKLADGSNTTFDANNPDIRFDKGGTLDEDKKEIYKKWKHLINMSASELGKFYFSKDGKEAGLSPSEAKSHGIHSGRQSARWIMKMKKTPIAEWTPEMWKWANRQISFVSRMRGNSGALYDEKGNRTRKLTSLLIWGHNPEKFEDGGGVGLKKGMNAISDIENNSTFQTIKEFVGGMFGKNETNGVSKYKRTGEKINGKDVVVRVSDHTLNNSNIESFEYVISIVVDRDLKHNKGYVGNQLKVETQYNYTEIRIPDNKSNVEQYIEELTDHIDNVGNPDIRFGSGGAVDSDVNVSKTPAPKSDRVYGSKTNAPKSAESANSAKEIELSDSVVSSIENKLKEHNHKNADKKISLAVGKAVVRRGMGAYSATHRPTISGGSPNSRVAWGLARLNAFIYKVENGNSKSGRYSQDNDLLDDLEIPHLKFENGGDADSIYDKWKSIVNMTAAELEKFYNSEEGKQAGLSREEANELGIHYGRESARWIIKMKKTPVSEWSPTMWEWAERQIGFNARMLGNKGPLYDDSGKKKEKNVGLFADGGPLEERYHQTSHANAEQIKKNGFITTEVWTAPDDEGNYGEVAVKVYAPKLKNPLFLDVDNLIEFKKGISYENAIELVDKNRGLYSNLGGETGGKKTYDALREMGYDGLIDGGDTAYLYPKNLVIEKNETQIRAELKLAFAAYKDFMGQRTSFDNDADKEKVRELGQKVMDLKYELRKPIDISGRLNHKSEPMQQIVTCIDRALKGEKPLAHKYKAFIDKGNLFLYHYHHLLLIYDIVHKKAVYTWHETPTDKRGINSAIQYLSHIEHKNVTELAAGGALPKRDIWIRFNLSNDANFGKWKIENKETGKVVYLDPEKVQIVMYNCILTNVAATAKKIFSGEANKSPISYVKCENADILYEVSYKPTQVKWLHYNPHLAPNWFNVKEENIDNTTYPRLITYNRRVYIFNAYNKLENLVRFEHGGEMERGGVVVQRKTFYHGVKKAENVKEIIANGFDLNKINPLWQNDLAVSVLNSPASVTEFFGREMPVLKIEFNGVIVEHGELPGIHAKDAQDYTKQILALGIDAVKIGRHQTFIYNVKAIQKITLGLQ